MTLVILQRFHAFLARVAGMGQGTYLNTIPNEDSKDG